MSSQKWTKKTRLLAGIVVAMAEVPDDLKGVVDVLRRQADAAEADGRWFDAESLHRKQLQLVEAELGKDHYATLAITANLSFSLHKMGRFEDAYALQKDLGERWLQQYKLGSANSITFLRGFVRTLSVLGKTEELAFWQERLVEASQNAYGPDSWKTVRATAFLARAKHKLGDHQAERKLVMALLLGDIGIVWKWLQPWRRPWRSPRSRPSQ